MTLDEKGLDYTTIEEDLSAPSAELLELHPEGKVPLLIHRGIPIHESAIITEYLEDVFPSPSLRPTRALERARMRMWTFWCDELLKPDLDQFKYEWNDLSEDKRVALLARLRDHLSKLARPLAEHPFLLGKELTLADVHVFPFYRQLQKARPDFSSLLRPTGQELIEAWLNRITGRPSFEKVMKKPQG